jgi:hypothetical protein
MTRHILNCILITTLLSTLSVVHAVAGEPVIIEPNGDRVHINRSEYADAAVLFMNIGADNWPDVLDQAKRGGFRVVLSTLFEPGSWTVPYQFEKRGVADRHAFADLESLARAVDAFRAEGIIVGMHGFMNLLVQDGGLVNFRAPPADWWQIIEGVQVGRLTRDIDASSRTIAIDTDIRLNPEWQHLAIQNKAISTWTTPFHYSTYAIDREMIRCTNDQITAKSMTSYRGVEQTTAEKHSAGTPVFYVPRKTGYFLLYYSEFQAQSVRDMVAAIDRLKLSYFYYDGNRYPNLIEEHYGLAIEGDYRRGLKPYVDAAGGLWQGSGAADGMLEHVRWMASGDAVWVRDSAGRFDIDRLLGIKRGIISREDTTRPYKFEAGWLPLDFDLTADGVAKVYADPTLKHRRKTWQEMPDWRKKPKRERDALLALIRAHEGPCE